MTWPTTPVTCKFIVKSSYRNCTMYLHLIDLKGKNRYVLLVFSFADLSFSNHLPIDEHFKFLGFPASNPKNPTLYETFL